MLPPELTRGQLACLHPTLLQSKEAEAFILGLIIGLVVGLLVPQQLLICDIDPIIPAAWQVCTCADFTGWWQVHCYGAPVRSCLLTGHVWSWSVWGGPRHCL